jgi:tetratricopeptide (TPR) repeat protein
MFFPKLRKKAKWVFLFIALVFGLGFLVAGVGTGFGSGLGDYVADLFNRPISTGGPDLEDARKAVQENPDNAEALLDLARAAQREGRVEESIGAFERYLVIEPVDTDALRTLSALYGQRIAEAQQRASIAQNQAEEYSLPRTFAPDDSPFTQELSTNPISQTLSSQAEARAALANEQASRYLDLQLGALATLTELVKDEPLLFLQYAQAAESAQDYVTAVGAYESFLELAPNHRAAEEIAQRVELLKQFAGLSEPGEEDAGDEPADEESE